MKQFVVPILTGLTSIICVPVVFMVLAVWYWTLIIPFIRTLAVEEGGGWHIFVWHMSAPVRVSVKMVLLFHTYINDAMNGVDTLHIKVS